MNQAAIRAYIARHVRRRDAVDNLAQEVFVAAFRGFDGYRGDAPLRSWLIGVARRRLYDYLREEMRRRAREADDLGAAIDGWRVERVESDTRSPLDREREAVALAACIRGLAKDKAELVRAHYFRGRSLTDLASALGRKESAVRMTLMRIRQGLRACVRSRLAMEGA